MKRITNISTEAAAENAAEKTEGIKLRPVSEGQKNTDSKRSHAVKIATNQLVKIAEDNDIPIFIAYYDPSRGYQYNGIFPEEIGTPDIASQYDRFLEFLKVCIGFNKEDNIPTIRKKEEE